IRRAAPTAAVTGTFFCLRTLIPTGDIVIGGRLVHFGGIGTGLCISPDNKVYFVPRPVYRHVDWTGYETVLCAGPRLLWDGKLCVNPRAEGFRDRRMIYARVPRLGVGVTAKGKLLMVLVSRPCHLSDLARVMKALGCTDAVDVDQGASAALYYRGWRIAKPKRLLTNILAVYDSTARYQAAVQRFAPWVAEAAQPSG
ncbi:MAG: phosphodiester glycosidase family protein, partial [Armatimonadota bacterium]